MTNQHPEVNQPVILKSSEVLANLLTLLAFNYQIYKKKICFFWNKNEFFFVFQISDYYLVLLWYTKYLLHISLKLYKKNILAVKFSIWNSKVYIISWGLKGYKSIKNSIKIKVG